MVDVHLLLTGGTGFFGRALLRHWHAMADRGAVKPPEVTVLSRDPERFRGEYPALCAAPWLQFLRGDIMDPDSLNAARASLEGTTHVMHAAADSTLGPKLSPLERFDQILEGTRHTLDLAVQLGARRFLLCSSGGVYGAPPAGVIHLEESFHGIPDPLVPSNAYSIAKRAAEHLCSLYAEQRGLEVVVARCFAFVGQDLPLGVHFAIGNFIRDALERDEITVAGDGRALRSYLDQRDLAEWLMVMLERGQPGRAYNVGSDEAISIGALAQLVGRLLASQKPVRILGAQAQGRSVYVPSIARARTELGLQVSVPLSTAILDAVAGGYGMG
jgi:UDP-glucuronate decarboxylase